MNASQTGSLPDPLEDDRRTLRSALEGASHLLACLDFDGTLAPIVDDPDAATPLAETERILERLAADPAVTTAIVSGRALADVRDRIDGPSVYAGNHGLELVREGSLAVHPIARKRATHVDTVCAVLETVLESVANVRIENKRLTGTVHLRSVPAASRPIVRRATREVVEWIGGDDLELSTGKCILEIGPSIGWGKGDAVELIAADLPPDTVVVYVGDDVTDESAFRAVEPDGIGVRVGTDEPTAASASVRSPADVATFLRWLYSDGLALLESPPSATP